MYSEMGSDMSKMGPRKHKRDEEMVYWVVLVVEMLLFGDERSIV